jgi:hypothetical protein
MPWAPYGLNPNDGTGLVYKTTLRFINNFKCPSLALPLPSLAE